MTRLLLAALALSACSAPPDCVPDSESATFTVDGDAAVLDGVIDCATQDRLADVTEASPEITTLRFSFGTGSADDEANLELGRAVYRAGLDTEVVPFAADADGEPVRGVIASGAVDLFLAGRRRTLGRGACVGVHSWADESGQEGRDLPVDDREHDPYLDYFDDIGYADGHAFYDFTLDVASIDGIYYMTPQDLSDFSVVTDGPPAVDCVLQDDLG